MAVAKKAFMLHREALDNDLKSLTYFETLLLRLEEREIINSTLRTDISECQAVPSKKRGMLFTALEAKFSSEPDTYWEFLGCLKTTEVFDSRVEQMKATHGKFTLYIMYEETLSLLNA